MFKFELVALKKRNRHSECCKNNFVLNKKIIGFYDVTIINNSTNNDKENLLLYICLILI